MRNVALELENADLPPLQDLSASRLERRRRERVNETHALELAAERCWCGGELEAVDPLETRVAELLFELAEHGDDKSANLADDLLVKYWHSLWRFIDTDGIDPTNNISERLLSILATCQRQHRSFRHYLAESLTAATRGNPIPLLT